MNLASALDGTTGSGPFGAGASPKPPGATFSGRLPPNFSRSEIDTTELECGFFGFSRFLLVRGSPRSRFYGSRVLLILRIGSTRRVRQCEPGEPRTRRTRRTG